MEKIKILERIRSLNREEEELTKVCSLSVIKMSVLEVNLNIDTMCTKSSLTSELT